MLRLLETITDPADLQAEALRRRSLGERIGFVPTMGFLHAGHLSLMEQARSQCDWLVVSIYVNPLQFGPDEDLDRYPRDAEGDAEKCRAMGVDCLFLPTDLYPPGHATTVSVASLTDGLCGASRPTHFDGVTTVVARLFGVVQPHVAVFGEKDYQQLAVIRRMARDLAMPVEVQGAPLVRDEDGVALSSRNAYLGPEDRKRARTLSQALFAMQLAVSEGQTDAGKLTAQARVALDVDAVDYLDIVDADDLSPLSVVDRPARALVAAHLGGTRLIDNVALLPSPTPTAP